MFFSVLALFWDRVSQGSPECHGTYSVDQAGLETGDQPASACWVLGLKMWAVYTPCLSLSKCTLKDLSLLLLLGRSLRLQGKRIVLILYLCVFLGTVFPFMVKVHALFFFSVDFQNANSSESIVCAILYYVSNFGTVFLLWKVCILLLNYNQIYFRR